MLQSEQPNIVFILTDDQGVWAAGCYGNPEIRTPNIDRIAATGVRFDNFFITIPVCSASRASILTGRLPSQHGVHDFIAGGAAEQRNYLEFSSRRIRRALKPPPHPAPLFLLRVAFPC